MVARAGRRVAPSASRSAPCLPASEVRLEWFNGTVGAGGQFRNKTATAARLTHLPTGLVRTAQTRSRKASLAAAGAALAEAVRDRAQAELAARENAHRRDLQGSGERSDKRRTWRSQDGTVHDHRTGRTARWRDVERGDFSALWGGQGA